MLGNTGCNDQNRSLINKNRCTLHRLWIVLLIFISCVSSYKKNGSSEADERKKKNSEAAKKCRQRKQMMAEDFKKVSVHIVLTSSNIDVS